MSSCSTAARSTSRRGNWPPTRLARSRSGVLVGGAKRLYGIVEGGDLAYVEERVDADGGLVPHLSARLARFVG